MSESLDMSFDASDTPEMPVETPRLGLRALTVDVLRRPSAAMTRLAEHPGRRWVWPLAALILVKVAVIFAQMPAASRFQRAVLQTQLGDGVGLDPEVASAMGDASGQLGLITTIFGAVFTVFAVLIGALIVAGILHFVGTVMGGQQSFTQVFTVTAWARLPVVIGGLVQLLAALAGNYDPCPQGLSGFVCPDPFGGDAQASYLAPVLAQIELWNLWFLVLLVIGVGAVSRVSRGKAIGAVAIVLASTLLLGIGGTAIGRAVGGMFGG